MNLKNWFFSKKLKVFRRSQQHNIEGLTKEDTLWLRPYDFAGVCQLSQDFRIVKKSDKLGKMRSAPLKSIF